MADWKNSENLLDSAKEIFQFCEDNYGNNWPVIVVNETGDHVVDQTFIVDLAKWRDNDGIDFSFDYVSEIVMMALGGCSLTATTRKYSFIDTYGYNSAEDAPWKTNTYLDRNFIEISVEIV